MKTKLNNILHTIKLPITSYGIIAFTIINKEIKYILINKRNTVGFCDLVKGNYIKSNNDLYLNNIINILTYEEVNVLLNNDFETIWKYMWNRNVDNLSSKIYTTNKDKINKILNYKKKYYNETEWEFPKGRKNFQEKELDCAKREFKEETGINKHFIDICFNINPLEEMYIGTNFNYYKHKYYIGFINSKYINLNTFQREEVNSIDLFSYKECNQKIRNYHKSKKECLFICNHILNNLKFLYSNNKIDE